MAKDIRPWGTQTERKWAWVQRRPGAIGDHALGGPYLELIGIDEVGEVTATGICRPFDERAPDQAGAVNYGQRLFAPKPEHERIARMMHPEEE